MKQLALLDISALIWDIGHFEANKPAYYKVMETLPNLYTGIMNNKIPLLIKGSLLNEIQAYFPYNQIPNEFHSFQYATLYFLSNATIWEYPSNNDTTVSCTPDLVKAYFEQSTKTEVRCLITYLYSDISNCKRLLSFNIFYNSKKNLTLSNSHSVDIDTLMCDDIVAHESIINKFKKIFEHNGKHDAYKSSEHEYHGEKISSLSCYNERIGNTKEAQALLDKAVEFKGALYSYDNKYKTYVKFVITGGNLYHGYDVLLSEDDLINLRKVYNK